MHYKNTWYLDAWCHQRERLLRVMQRQADGRRAASAAAVPAAAPEGEHGLLQRIRAFFGLPDIKPMQDRIMGEIEERLRSSLGAMNPETVFKTWLPASMQGIDQMQQMQQAFWSQLANIATGTGGKKE